MTCKELVEFLLDYHEQRLSSQERERFDSHLAICPDCRSYLDSYGKTVELAKLATEEPVPPEVPDELIDAILRSRRR